MRARSSVGGGDERVDDPDATNVLFELWRLARAANALLAGPLASMGMSGDEFGIYSVLSTNADGVAPTVLAEWMSAAPTTVSSHIKRLEARGHVARHPDPHDGRAAVVRLTPAGRRALRRATATYEPVLDAVRGRLGSDEPSVRAAPVTLRRAIDAAHAGDEAPSPTS